MKKFTRGFTLIELLVVIAIIGILSSVVLVSLNSARDKGGDAAVRANIAGIRSNAEIIYDSNGNNYSTVCSATNVQAALNAARSAAGVANAINTTYATAGAAATVTCHSTTGAWAVESPLKTSGFYCVDSTGISATTSASTLAASDAVCN